MDPVINYWGVLIAAIMYYILGAIWYSPLLFSKAWMKALNLTPEDMKKKQHLWLAYIGALAASLMMSYVLAHIVDYSQAKGIPGGFLAGFFCWLGFVVTTSAINYLFEQRPFKLYLLNIGYNFVGLIMMGVMLSVWR